MAKYSQSSEELNDTVDEPRDADKDCGKGNDGNLKENEPEQLVIKVIDQSGDQTRFRVNRTSLISRILDAYCKRKSLSKKGLRFLYDGHHIAVGATPETLQMEDNDIIEVYAEQIGGTLEI